MAEDAPSLSGGARLAVVLAEDATSPGGGAWLAAGLIRDAVSPGGGAGPTTGGTGGGPMLDESFVPPDDEFCWTQITGPDNGRPPELAGLTEEDLQPLITPPVLVPAAWPEGIVPPDGFPTPVPPTLGGPGFGFGQGDLLDLMPPGVTLAGLAEDAHNGLAEDTHGGVAGDAQSGLAGLAEDVKGGLAGDVQGGLAGDAHGGVAGDVQSGLAGDAHGGVAGDVQGGLAGIDSDCLVGVIRAWRRITSWATGRELAAVAELARRYPADGLPGSGCEYVADELSAALTLTGRAAQ
ncbi:MAG TPA: hypothetical protein VHY58_12565, partial [Streptosporangiaceae bacterium]|nr:hypothetical protein [Streptosporangiaceae bacterium]